MSPRGIFFFVPHRFAARTQTVIHKRSGVATVHIYPCLAPGHPKKKIQSDSLHRLMSTRISDTSIAFSTSSREKKMSHRTLVRKSRGSVVCCLSATRRISDRTASSIFMKRGLTVSCRMCVCLISFWYFPSPSSPFSSHTRHSSFRVSFPQEPSETDTDVFVGRPERRNPILDGDR